MRHHEAGATLEQFLQRRLETRLGHRINGTGRLIQNQNFGICEHGPGKANQLALTQGDPGAALPDHGVESQGQDGNQVQTIE